jgi:hypothetical protein
MVPDIDNSKFTVLQSLHRNADPEKIVEARLGQHQQILQQKEDHITRVMQERLIDASKNNSDLSAEVANIDLWEAHESQVNVINEVLRKTLQTQSELEEELKRGKERLELLNAKKMEFNQRQQELRHALETPNAKTAYYEERIYALGGKLNDYISGKREGS